VLVVEKGACWLVVWLDSGVEERSFEGAGGGLYNHGSCSYRTCLTPLGNTMAQLKRSAFGSRAVEAPRSSFTWLATDFTTGESGLLLLLKRRTDTTHRRDT
jgi:hypothetical protein